MRAEILRGSGYSAYRARLESLLEISVSASDMDIHNSITQGFPVARLVQLTENGTVSPLERDQIMPPQTLKNRINASSKRGHVQRGGVYGEKCLRSYRAFI